MHEGTQQNTVVIQDRNTYIVNNFPGKYATQYCKKLDSRTRTLFPVIIQGPYIRKFPVQDGRNV